MNLLAGIDVPSGVRVKAEQLFQLNSFNLTVDDMLTLARRLSVLLQDDDVDGVVVTHGTDTMEETSFLQQLVLDPMKPVVFTGAQLAADLDDADGPANLREALIVAASPRSAGIGSVVVFAGTIWQASGMRKVHTLDRRAFGSQSRRVGTVDAGGVVTIERPAGQHPLFDVLPLTDILPRVDIVSCYPGVDSVALDAVVAAGARGLIIDGMGAGNPGRSLARGLAGFLADGGPVVLTSRVAEGVAAAVYGNGGGADVVAAGAVLGGGYRAPQLRILLTVALASTGSTGEALRRVAAYVGQPG